MHKDKNIFYERLMEEVALTRKTVNRVERELGYPRNALHNYKNGTFPSGERLIELSHYFKVSPEYLLGKVSESNRLSVEYIFNDLTDTQKLLMNKLCHNWTTSELNKII